MSFRLIQVVCVTASLLVSGTSLAQSTPEADPAPTVAPAAPAAKPRSSASTWGTVIVISSIAMGAAITSYGLTIDCEDDDLSCHRRAALPIGGGLGVAAVGSLVGLRIMAMDRGPSVAVLQLTTSF